MTAPAELSPGNKTSPAREQVKPQDGRGERELPQPGGPQRTQQDKDVASCRQDPEQTGGCVLFLYTPWVMPGAHHGAHAELQAVPPAAAMLHRAMGTNGTGKRRKQRDRPTAAAWP